MKKIIAIAFIAMISCIGCTKVTTQETTISNDLKPISVSITADNNTSNTVPVK